MLPLTELEEAGAEEGLEISDGNRRIRYDPEGVVAWMETRHGELVPGQMVYRRAWLSFHPGARIFRTGTP